MCPHSRQDKAVRRAPSTPVDHQIDPRDLAALPGTIDWVAKGAVTPVKDQGSCGSWYGAFSCFPRPLTSRD